MAKKKAKKAPAKKATKKPAKKAAKKPASKAKARKPAAKKSASKKAAPKGADSGFHPTHSHLKEGSAAPSFTLMTDEGKMVSLSDFVGKNVVLYFYPKDMTPGCTIEACDFRDARESFERFNTVVLGVSKDSVESHRKFKEKYHLNFPLLSDEDGKVCEAYGVWQQKQFMGREFMGIVRTTFIIGPNGKIKRVYPEVHVNGHSAQVAQDLAA
ncbi:MAG: thioredoxin-dependent thiol peroxidase [Bdellovibrionales bacterium]|nr:thioredoxin-dependent thiol peroxidase [Bdellovibrionales bacterium]